VIVPLRVDLALIGFGHVGQRFALLLEERRELLIRDEGLDCRVVGFTTRHHGGAFNGQGIDCALVRHLPGTSTRSLSALDLIEQLRRSPADLRVVVETTTLDIHQGQPAIDHVRAAIAAGCHVVTANKGPAAFAFAALNDEATAAGVSFLF
jgi:homoserine dehydrogenase